MSDGQSNDEDQDWGRDRRGDTPDPCPKDLYPYKGRIPQDWIDDWQRYWAQVSRGRRSYTCQLCCIVGHQTIKCPRYLPAIKLADTYKEILYKKKLADEQEEKNPLLQKTAQLEEERAKWDELSWAESRRKLIRCLGLLFLLIVFAATCTLWR
ncbi:hypothetical protein NX059_009888 [Plenodomus lindquistii]|nr:hypothetical protein NX059_009888 [Plenodomus lindquistii]